jgi:hypothetical protein
MLAGFAVQLLNGLAGASALFLVAVGLSLIFGVTRIVNFAWHPEERSDEGSLALRAIGTFFPRSRCGSE